MYRLYAWGMALLSFVGAVSQQRVNIRNEVLHHIKERYVDEISDEKLTASTPEGLVAVLDPHSEYVPRERVDEWTRRGRGIQFSIGILFEIIDGVVTVTDVLEGGAAAANDILPGDQIFAVGGTSLAGAADEWAVYDALMGADGTRVVVTIQRPGERGTRDIVFTRRITRPPAVSSAFIVNSGVGYVRLREFSEGSADEVRCSLEDLDRRGMSLLVFDLRDNGGGFRNEAEAILDFFLPTGVTVFETRGRWCPDRMYYCPANSVSQTQQPALYPNLPIIMLVNERSASASELVSGTLQDLDRVLLVGDRTFGKGLVQNVFPLADGSRLSLTISRYYLPSGRFIQTPYDGHARQPYLDRKRTLVYESGSLHHTAHGRRVYAGAGIMPDVWKESPAFHPMAAYLWRENNLFQWAVELVTLYPTIIPKNRDQFSSFVLHDSMIDEIEVKFFDKLLAAVEQGYLPLGIDVRDAREDLRLLLRSEIARVRWGREAQEQILLADDLQMQSALTLRKEAEDMLDLFYH